MSRRRGRKPYTQEKNRKTYNYMTAPQFKGTAPKFGEHEFDHAEDATYYGSGTYYSAEKYPEYREPVVYRRLLSFDFDGVLHEHRNWRGTFGNVSAELIFEAQERGWAVGVSTCNDVTRVAAALRRQGVRVLIDHDMKHSDWNGGRDGKLVVVTNRKLSAHAYVDDRNIKYVYGQDDNLIWDELTRMEGYAPCPAGRHWGPLGAAGIIPFSVYRGQAYVLLGKRSRGVQQPGTWGGFGGALDEFDETPWDGAIRELYEEVHGLGAEGESKGKFEYECPGCGWKYTTFLVEVALTEAGFLSQARIPKGFDGWETDELRWVPVWQVADYKLHPAMAGSTWEYFHARINRGTDESIRAAKPERTFNIWNGVLPKTS